MTRVLSFDIDGTLEVGDPAGVVTRQHLLLQREQGYLIGSASDRTEEDQRRIWRAMGVAPDFVVLKHRLAEVRIHFPDAQEYWHIGDAFLDEHYATQAGFIYWAPHAFSATMTAD